MPIFQESLPEVRTGSHPVFDRPALALTNLMSGDWSGAGKALYDPDALTPSQRTTLAKRWGVQGTLWEPVLNVTTNPLVLAGILLSVRFKIPTAQELAIFKGGLQKLPARMPWARFIGPASENFRNTEIVPLLQGISRERYGVQKHFYESIGDIMSELKGAIGRDYLTKQEQGVVAALMDRIYDPNHQVWAVARNYLTKTAKRPDLARALEDPLRNFRLSLDQVPVHLKRVAERTREVFDRSWDRWLADPDNQRRLREVLGRMSGFKDAVNFQELRQISTYWPHTRIMTPEQRLDAVRRYTQHFFRTRAQRAVTRGAELRQASAATADRVGKMLPDPIVLKELGASDDVIEAIFYRDKNRIQSLLARGEKLTPDVATTAVTQDGVPIFYSLRYGGGIREYVSKLSNAVAFNIPPVKYAGSATPSYADRLSVAVDGIAHQDPYMGRVLADTILPQSAGGLSVAQSTRSMWWASVKRSTLEWLDKPYMQKALGGLHGKVRDWVAYDPGSTYQGIGGSIAGWFYGTTIGAPNPVPTGFNLLQSLSTFAPLGVKYWGKGFSRASQQFMKYVELRLSGVPKAKAVDRAMPAFSKMHLEMDPTAHEGIQDLLESSMDRVFQMGTPRKITRQVQSSLMSMFSHSELFNRLVSFEGALAKGLDELPGGYWHFVDRARRIKLPHSRSHPLVQQAASEFASEATLMTQFGGGPLQRPMGTLNLWPPWAQFTTFPLRLLSLATGPMLRHPGYGARAMLMAGLTYEGVKQGIGADISRGLLFGGLPEPSGYGPFPVLPVVPPLLQLAGAGVLSAVTGESEHVRRTLPLLAPGGVGLARALPYVPGIGKPVGEAIRKSYADWDKRTPDGRVPVYTAQGQLKGYYTDTQLMAAAWGLGDISGTQERELTKYLLGQRDQIRGMRRQYLEALSQNDPVDAIRLQERYESAYPGMGGIPVKQSDIRALHLRQDVARLERILETMPAELRPQFQALIGVVLGTNYQEFLGLMQGGLMSGGTINLREPYRTRPVGETQRRVSQGLHGVKLREKLRRRGIDVSNAGIPHGLYHESYTYYRRAS